MDITQEEHLTKAHQAAQLLVADLRVAYRENDSVSLEIVLTDMIEAVERISQRLGRLAGASRL
jgi:hypothetical protein